MSRKHLLLAAQLLLSLVLSACGGGDSAGPEAPLSSEERVLKAQTLIAEKQGEAAIRQLRRALQEDQNNAQARFLLGKLYFENQDMTLASRELKRALELGYATSETTTLLARVYLAQQNNRDLQAISLDTLRPADKGTVLALQGMSLVRRGFTEQGKERVAQAVRLSPSNDEARLNYGRLLADDDDLIGARAQAEAVLIRDEENAEAWMLLANIEFIEGHLAGAEDAYSEAMGAALNPTEAQLKRAQLRIEREDLAGAQADVDAMNARIPNNPSVQYVQAIIHFAQERYAQALNALAIAESDLERHPEALLYAGMAHQKLGNYNQARSYANRYQGLKPSSVYGRRLLAHVALSKGEYYEAGKQLQALVDLNPEDVASLNLLANTHLAQGDTEAGLDLLARVVALRPDSSVALSRLAAGQLLAGDRLTGVAQLESALAIDPHFQQAEILLVLTHARHGEYDQALVAAESFRRRYPESARPLNLLGRIYLEAGQEEQAGRAYESALAIESGDAAARHGLAQLALRRGDLAAAKAHYDAVLVQDENHLPTLLKLAQLSAQRNNTADMLVYLRRAIAAHPHEAAPQVLLAQYYLSVDEPAQVSRLVSGMDDDVKSHPDVLRVLALAQLAQRDYVGAKYTIDSLSIQQPGAADVHYLKAQLHAALDERDALRQELTAALQISPDYLDAHSMIARLYLSEGDVRGAEPHLRRLAELAPESGERFLLEAAAARAKGDQQAAIEFAEQAFAAAPGTTSLLHLVGYLHQQGDYRREKDLLGGWVEAHPGDVPARVAQANLYALLNEYGAAIGQYLEVLKLDDNNVAALNGLAWYMQDSEPREALQYAQRLVELEPDSAAAQDTLAMVLLKNGESQKAGWAINRALLRDPDNPSVRYHSALISARAGRSDEALEMLEALLVPTASFPERAEAEALLREMRGGS